MRFKTIGINDSRVKLVRVEKDGTTGAIETKELESPERPKADFDAAFQGFKGYVIGLLPFTVGEEQIVVTTVNLSESKDGRRGLQVSCNIPIEKCDGKVSSFTTPLVHEPGEDLFPDVFTLSAEVMKLIALVEAEATKYVGGERMPLSAGDPVEASENAKEFDENAAPAEVQSTRKPRGRKGKGAEATALTVM